MKREKHNLACDILLTYIAVLAIVSCLVVLAM